MTRKDEKQWKECLMEKVEQEGGTLENGWEVKVKRRPSGGRDITVKSKDGKTFRSVAQAAHALAGGSTPKSKPALKEEGEGKRQRKKRRLSLSASPVKPAKGKGKVADQEGAAGKKKKQKKANGGIGNGLPPEEEHPPLKHPIFDKLLSQGRQHVARIRRELDILEVYEAEGWRGSNKDKLKPRAEMQRAEEQMERSKEVLRGIVRQCEEGEGVAIPAELYDSDGDLDEAHIRCAICQSGESTDANDLVLCDGPCRRAYHEKCCIPRFSAAELDEEADWLCPACYAKDEILDVINEEFGTSYELDSPAADLLEDAEVLQRKGKPEGGGAGAAGGTWAALLGGGDLVSSDSDDDYEWKGADRGGGAADCEGLIPASTPYGSSSSSGSSDEDSEEEAVELGPRARKKVDYVAMNSQMFGEEEEEGSSGSDYS